MNICDYIKKKNVLHEVLPDGRIKQICALKIRRRGITSLDGFVQNGHLDLSYNMISSLDGFEQNGFLNLSYNKISSLDGFEQNGKLNLKNNKISSLENLSINSEYPLILEGNEVYRLFRIYLCENHTKVIQVIYSRGKFYFGTNYSNVSCTNIGFMKEML
jgi:hypothetical protein